VDLRADPAHSGGMVVVLTWIGIIALAVCVASWAKYVINRNSADEVEARIDRPVILTGIFVVALAAALVAQALQD
jgi:hypothetical protein